MDRAAETTAWHTDEPCPVCAAGLFLVGHGEPVQVAECRLCAWSERWELNAAQDGNRGDAA